MNTPTQFRIRSYVPRGRSTAAQEEAYNRLWPEVGLNVDDGFINPAQIFKTDAPCFLEIGFGSGQALVALAKQEPHHHFIGVEAHTPGIGSLLMAIDQHQLRNIRVYHADVIDVLTQCIPDSSLMGVQIFFPDPWPKRRHFQRRLIQADFMALVQQKLKIGGECHLATDWEDYAKYMMLVCRDVSGLRNLAGVDAFAARSSKRLIVTKFESRAVREGRSIWEIQLVAEEK